MTMTGAEDYLKEIIRLQLKKPRSWNWELSTSKSSPHIALPTIQLYNTKGKLLVETNDNGSTNRQNWHSSQHRDRSRDRDSTRSSRNPGYLQRCKSDNLEKRMAQYRSAMASPVRPTLEIEATEIRKQPKAIQRCRSDTLAIPPVLNIIANKTTEPLKPWMSRSNDGRLDKLREKYDPETNGKSSGGSGDYVKSNKGKLGKFGQLVEGMKNDKREYKNTGGIYRLQKSRSDVLDIKVTPKPQHTLSDRRPIRPYHRRADSDDLIQKTRQKYNIKESLKRAENDGYKNFIYSDENLRRIDRGRSLEKKEVETKEEKKKRLFGCLATAETVLCNNKPTNFEVSNVAKPRRYRLRQSRAGILVISDESFSSSHRRRCHGDFGDCRDDSNDVIIEGDKMNSLEDFPIFKENPRSFRCLPQRSRPAKEEVDVRRTLHDVSSNNSSRHFRQSSDPAGVKTAKFPPNRYRRPQHTNDVSNNVERSDSTREAFSTRRAPKKEICLFQSKSDIFPFQKLFNDKTTKYYDNCDKYDKTLPLALDENSNYIVQEPLTTPGSESDKNICDSVTISDKKKRTKVKERHSEGPYPRTTRKDTNEGTSTRPILSDSEADLLTKERYLDPWNPEVIELPTSTAYVVGKTGRFLSVQEAVNAVILESVNSTERKFIYVDEGVYKETVFIPSGTIPITIYGHPKSKIVLNQSANMPVTDWIAQVNPNGTRYQPDDPAYSMFEGCAKNRGTIGTRCTSVVWIKGNQIQLVNITMENFALNTSDGQAVALRSDALEIQLDNVRLLGRQDTFYVGSGTVFINNSYLEGDTDYVFGQGTAVFNNCTFKTVSDRKPIAVIFAPKTDFASSYGFLVTNSVITSDDGFGNSMQVRLGRPWDSDVYLPDQSPNGQLLIRNSKIDAIANVTGPWGQGIGSARNFLADISKDRDLNDNRFNRFWEYQNYGNGA